MPPWFWGWTVSACGLALVAVIAKDRAAAAFLPGAVAAVIAAGLRGSIGLQWTLFLVPSFPLLVLAVRRRYTRRHSVGSADRDEPARDPR